MKFNKLATILFFAGVLLLFGCGSSDDPVTGSTENPAPTQPSDVIDSTTITTTSGDVIRVNSTANGLIFDGHQGKIVLLEIYGDSCPHCIASIPGYNQLQNKYPNDVYVITIESYGLNNAALQQYVNQYGIQYATVASENSGSMFPFIKRLTGYTTNQGVPYLMVFSRDGNLAQDFRVGADLDVGTVDGLIQSLR